MIKIGDIVKIKEPGCNYPSSYKLAAENNLKYYKYRTLLGETWWLNKEFEVIGMVDVDYKTIAFIRNYDLEIDLIIKVTGLKLVKHKPIIKLTDEDFLI
jgi:hypothetical protein